MNIINKSIRLYDFFGKNQEGCFFLTIKIADNINMIAEVFHVFYWLGKNPDRNRGNSIDT